MIRFLRVALAPAAVGLIIAALAAGGGRSGALTEPDHGVQAAANYGLAVGAQAPEFSLIDADGRRWELNRLRGRSLLLLFLCGCDRCKAMARALAHRPLLARRAEVLVISHMGPGDAYQFQRETGLTAPFLFDPFGDVAACYGSLACPQCWALDQQGRVVYKSCGPREDIALVMRSIDHRSARPWEARR